MDILYKINRGGHYKKKKMYEMILRSHIKILHIELTADAAINQQQLISYAHSI